MKKFLSLFLALCMLMACTVFALPASADVVAPIEFSDNFDTETDTIPDNWVMATENIPTATVAVAEENGNKFLRYFTGPAGDGETTRGGITTKDGLVKLPFSGSEKIIFSFRMRTSDANYRSQSNLGGTATDCVNKDYMLTVFRGYGIRHASSEYKDGSQNTATLAQPTVVAGQWYGVTVEIIPSTRAASFTFVDESDNNAIYTGSGVLASGTFGQSTFTEIERIAFTTSHAEGHNIDIDDVSVGYYHAPIVRSFANDFENETPNSAPADWEDRNGVASLSVMEDTDGNNFVRITKNAGNGVPMVALKDGKINMPLKEGNKKAVVVEAKIRKSSADNYRSLLMMNPPKNIASDSTAYGYNKYTLFYLHTTTNLGMNAVTGTNADGQWLNNNVGNYAIGDWVTYRMVYIPDTGELRHYINNSHKSTVTSGLPAAFTAMDALTALAFTWRETGETTAGTMDFDDVKIWEWSDEPEVTSIRYTSNEVVNSDIGTFATIRGGGSEHGNPQTYLVALVLYDKHDDGTLSVADVKLGTQEVSPWREATKYLETTVTSKHTQVLKTFVWKNLTYKPLCEAGTLGTVD